MEYLNLNIVQEKIVEIDKQKVIFDNDVAEL
jgi:hypothetical protein